MQRTYIKDLKDFLGSTVSISGWIDVRRDQGKMIFLDFRDMTGIVQGVILPNYIDTLEVGKTLRSEFVVKVEGKVNKRPDRNIKEGILNGELEMEILNIEILNEAKTSPFQINEDTSGINEDLRMKYKYLDLR